MPITLEAGTTQLLLPYLPPEMAPEEEAAILRKVAKYLEFTVDDRIGRKQIRKNGTRAPNIRPGSPDNSGPKKLMESFEEHWLSTWDEIKELRRHAKQLERSTH